MRFELTTFCLGSKHSTTELRPLIGFGGKFDDKAAVPLLSTRRQSIATYSVATYSVATVSLLPGSFAGIGSNSRLQD